MIAQPLARVRGIPFEPGTCAAQTKAVTPGVHVRKQPRPPDAWQLVRQQQLQIAHRRLLEVVAAGIPIEARAPRGSHADVVTRLVQHGMHRGVEPRVQAIGLQARLAVPPVGSRNAFPGGDEGQLHPVAGEEQRQGHAIGGVQQEHGGRCGHGCGRMGPVIRPRDSRRP